MPDKSDSQHGSCKSTLSISRCSSPYCRHGELICDSSTSEDSEDPDASINLTIRNLETTSPPFTLPHESDQSLHAEVLRIQARVLAANSDAANSTYGTVTPSTSSSSTAATMANTLRLPDFKMCKEFDGQSNAARWLTKLSYDFERAGHSPPPPQLFLTR